ncbi:fungal-specific transcription factor domain-containing protein [Lophiotrema nucula]|uniref:Fungal-specific transcription factor domain-containing protein n=1 Tax=Lophiotrema nucula TaxID=690887 RepID=A0A6A5YMF4_9PLEO|nr:fungal-specific transcription factor domain-containing protein [Lophiotrema nucula]
MADTTNPHRFVPPSRRRDKPILSCNLCRRRKLKCDRQQPCKTCLDRGLSLSCAYTRSIPSSSHESKGHNVHDRIDQLERLVSTLMNQNGSPSPHTVESSHFATPPTSTEDEADPEIETPDRVKLEDDATSYTNSGHWTSILDGIAELREHLDEIPSTAQPRDPTQSEIIGPDLLFGRQKHANLNELLAAIPSKPEADRLLATYFTSMDMSGAIIHKPTFLKEYEQFWRQPFEVSIMWLGLLFSIFCIATRFQFVLEYKGDGASDDANSALANARMDFYRTKLVQAMVLANYAKCPPYTVEVFVQYFITEYFRSADAQFATWVLVGMLVRMAFRTGLHRDGSHFPNLSPFKSEMRRRAWSMIVQLDLMSSSQMGLPRMIQKDMYDTDLPRNLRDDDLFEEMTELPPSRVDTDSTPMLHTIWRNQVLDVFARIQDLANANKQPQYRDIMALDAELRVVFESLPPQMQVVRCSDLNLLIAEDDDAKRRLYLGLTFLKVEMVLHRPYLLLGRTDSRYKYSRLTCVDAALEILEFQKMIEQESRPDGKLWSFKWRLWSLSWKLSSLVNHDFLLATTVLALDLDRDLIDPLPASSEAVNSAITSPRRLRLGKPTRAEIIEALSYSYGIWIQAAEKSREARKVAAAVKLVLGKANAAPSPTPSQPDIVVPDGELETLQLLD